MSDWRMAVHYRNRAELLRVIAEETTQKEHSHALRKVAEFYDDMAATVERDTRAKASPETKPWPAESSRLS